MEAAADKSIQSDGAAGARAILRGLIAFLALAAVLFGLAEQSYQVKRNAARELFENLMFSRVTVEARQHIRRIEYGIKNGRELEQFYNIDGILRDIQRISSYITGVYVIGRNDELLYSHTIGNDEAVLRRPRDLSFDAGNVYQMVDSADRFDLFLPVYDPDGRDIAYIIIRLDRDVVHFSIQGLAEQESTQSLTIAVLLLGIGMIIVFAAKPKPGGVILLVLILGFLGLTLDLWLAFNRFSGIAESATVQSVNRIAQLLQSDVELIRSMGVPPEAIHDQNSWLRQAVQGIPMIHSGSIDSNMRITLTASRTYFNQYSTSLLSNYAMIYAVLLLLAVAAAIVRISRLKRADRKESEVRDRKSEYGG